MEGTQAESQGKRGAYEHDYPQYPHCFFHDASPSFASILRQRAIPVNDHERGMERLGI
jgi:hypothetical protein